MFDVRPLSGTLGAEVTGVDLADLDDAAFDRLHELIVDHGVLALRDQDLDEEAYVAFGARFGELTVHPIVPHIEGWPPLLNITNRGKRDTITEHWHSDVTFEARPPKFSILYGRVLPEAGGDTMFADQRVAYDRLSDGMKALLEPLRAVHYGAGLAETFAGRGGRQETDDIGVPTSSHPVVITHPESDRRALFVNVAFTRHFEDMTSEESRPLLRQLWKLGTTPDLTCRVVWGPGTIVVWDNRSVQHYAVHDHGDQTRDMWRLTVLGEQPCS